jgi:hypothetical protein
MTMIAIAQAFGNISAAKSGQIAADSQNRIAKIQLKLNNEMRDIQKRDILTQGDIQAANIHAQTREIIGQQKVGFAGQGIDVDSDIAKQLRAEARENSQADAEAAKINAANKAWGIEIEKSDAIANTGYQNAARRNMADATLAEAGISGFANVAATAYKYESKSGKKTSKG